MISFILILYLSDDINNKIFILNIIDLWHYFLKFYFSIINYLYAKYSSKKMKIKRKNPAIWKYISNSPIAHFT